MAQIKAPIDLPAVDAARRNRLLQDVLKGVSRSFYLSLRVLPKSLREPVGLAYILARAADTISDQRAGSTVARLEGLLALRAQVVGPADLGVVRELASRSVEEVSSPEERVPTPALQ